MKGDSLESVFGRALDVVDDVDIEFEAAMEAKARVGKTATPEEPLKQVSAAFARRFTFDYIRPGLFT